MQTTDERSEPLDVYEEISKANEEFRHPERQRVLVCSNCGKRINLLTGGELEHKMECPTCGFYMLF